MRRVLLLILVMLTPVFSVEDVNRPGETVKISKHFQEGQKTMVFYHARWDKTSNRLNVELIEFDKTDQDWIILRVHVKNLKDAVSREHGLKNVPAFKLYDEKGRLMAQGATAYSEVLNLLEDQRR